MREDRKLGFLESIMISAATGAISGGICGVGNVPEENRNEFTSIMVDLALNGAQKLKERDREGYFKGL